MKEHVSGLWIKSRGSLLTSELPGWAKLLGALAIVAAVWLVALPWLARQSHVSAHIELQERQGIDPSAMFYSELEIVPPIAHRVERLHETHEGAFWSR